MDKKKILILTLTILAIVISLSFLAYFKIFNEQVDKNIDIEKVEKIDGDEIKSHEEPPIDLDIIEALDNDDKKDFVNPKIEKDEDNIKKELASGDDSKEKGKITVNEKTGVESYSKTNSESSFFGSNVDYDVSKENKKDFNTDIDISALNKDYSTTENVKKGKNKVSVKFEGKIPDNYEYYTNSDNSISISEKGKEKEGVKFSYSLNKDNGFDTVGSSTYSSETVAIRGQFYLKNKDSIINLITLTGYKLTKEEIMTNIESALKIDEFSSFEYKEYRFLRNVDDMIFIEKTK